MRGPRTIRCLTRSVDWETAIGLGGAVALAALTLAREWATTRSARSRIRDDIEILDKLPAESPAADALRAHIERAILRLVESDQTHRRDPSGLILTAFFVAATAWTVRAAATGSDWWFLAVFGLGLFAIAGFATSFPKVPRDESGREIKKPLES